MNKILYCYRIVGIHKNDPDAPEPEVCEILCSGFEEAKEHMSKWFVNAYIDGIVHTRVSMVSTGKVLFDSLGEKEDYKCIFGCY